MSQARPVPVRWRKPSCTAPRAALAWNPIRRLPSSGSLRCAYRRTRPREWSSSFRADVVLAVHCATSLKELAAEREELNAINRASRLPDPFSTFEFYEIYFEHDEFFRHGVDTQLWFLTMREEGRIVGYLPLRIMVTPRAISVLWRRRYEILEMTRLRSSRSFTFSNSSKC